MRTAAAAVIASASAFSVAACGGSPASLDGSTTAPGSARMNGALAFARCMRSHGVPSFPDPHPDGSFPSFESGVPKRISATASGACEHVLSSGGAATQAQREQKLAFGVKVAECLRVHGYPTFPDPTHLGSQSLPSGIDPQSPQFQTAETACEKDARRALGLP